MNEKRDENGLNLQRILFCQPNRFQYVLFVFHSCKTGSGPVHWDTVILDTVTLICITIMQVHRMQPIQHLNIRRQIRIVVQLMQILSQLLVVVASAAAAVALVTNTRTTKRPINQRHPIDTGIMCCVNPSSTMATMAAMAR